MASTLRKLSGLIWLLIGGAGVLFVLSALILAATHPHTPANALVDRHTAWLFLPSVLMAGAGIYVSLRYWRCPHCGSPVPTRYPIPRKCLHCGRDIGL